MAGAKHLSRALSATTDLGLLMLPGVRLPEYRPTTVNNVTTIDDALLDARVR